MKTFLKMLDRLAFSSTAAHRVESLCAYLKEASVEDAAWAAHLLAGRKLPTMIKGVQLRDWAREFAGIEDWLFAESLASVGDLSETIALLVEGGDSALPSNEGLAHWIGQRLLPFQSLSELEQKSLIFAWWRQATLEEATLLNRLLTGEFKTNLAPTLLVRALAQHVGRPEAVVSHRLWTEWQPDSKFYEWLRADDGAAGDSVAKPYPFCLGSVASNAFQADDQWAAEWKWEGVRAQVIRREHKSFIWLRWEENATDWFPEIRDAALLEIPEGTVIDGEILAWRAGQSSPPLALQSRLGQQSPTRKILRECPVVFMAYDLLEQNGQDQRHLSWQARRSLLESTLRRSSFVFRVSPLLDSKELGDIQSFARAARRGGIGGLVLKNINSVYGCGRQDSWLKLKADSYKLDAVLLYAHGSGDEVEYTFGLRAAEGLVTIAKTSDGLSSEERKALESWVRANTRERFGPVRSVPGVQVFELEFDGIQESSRHKSGFALTRPRVTCWKREASPSEADAIEALHALYRDPRPALQ